MSRLRREDHPGLTDDQFARTDAMLDRMICQNIDWLADRASLSDYHLQSQLDWYEDRALDRSHESASAQMYFNNSFVAALVMGDVLEKTGRSPLAAALITADAMHHQEHLFQTLR